MRPPFAYYGGKIRLAPWIASLLPPHRVYVEPFAGSAAVLLAKAPCEHEVLNDVDGNVVTFFRVLRDQPDDLERVCSLTPYAREEFTAADLAGDDIDDLERARRFWIRCTQSFASLPTQSTGWATSIAQHVNNARTSATGVTRIADVATRLRTVAIENRDAIEILGRYAAPDAVVYLDPPYLGSIRTTYRDGRRPGGDYAHEFHTEDDHRQLAEAAHAYPGTVVISSYASPLYDELYGDWSRFERDVQHRSGPASTETVWCSDRTASDRLFDLDPLPARHRGDRPSSQLARAGGSVVIEESA